MAVMIPNTDFIVSNPHLDASWTFRIDDVGESVQESHQNVTTVISLISDAFGCFYRPTSIEVGEFTYPNEVSLDQIYDFESTDLIAESYEYEDQDGLDVSEIFEQFSESTTEDGYQRIVSNVKFGSGLTKFYISGENRYLCSENDQYYKVVNRRNEDDILGSSSIDPLRFEVSHDIDGYDDSSPMTSILVSVYTDTDIWFKDTTIGAINRGRLVTCLNQFKEELEPDRIQFFADSLSESTLEEEDHLTDLAIHSRE
ncbi:hypothetical protein [Halogeometricum borinquense]|uniref:hypothetical protein n=1 Tax=Halogeometricum borinquense TaxID=60847 RepID=UPI00117E5DEF|nr:hypothetical protein [Halogeometricum borinquense]